MRMSCLSKIKISENEKVRMFVIENNKFGKKEEMLKGYGSSTHFLAVGAAMKGTLSSRGYVEIEDTLQSKITMERIKELTNRIDEELTWEQIQTEIYSGTLSNIKSKTFNIALIDENVYQMCLKEDNFYGQSFLNYKSSHLSDLLKVKSLPLQNCFKKYMDMIDGDENYESESLKIKRNSLSIHFNINDSDFFINELFSRCDLIDSLIEDNEEDFLENCFVLDVLGKNGLYLTPSIVINDRTEATKMLSLLIKDQADARNLME